jgi:hypothetical protein
MRLLRDLVDLSEIEAGGLELERRACEPHALARECLDRARAQATERGVVLKLECASPVPARIDSDCARLGRILDVLVANAIQRSPRGREVRLRMAFDPAPSWQEPQLHLAVIDRGEPIAPETPGPALRAVRLRIEERGRPVPLQAPGAAARRRRERAKRARARHELRAVGPNRRARRVAMLE